MRWLLAKDLRVLRRSPLLLALLVAYPVIVSVMAGMALSSGPERPRVAVADLIDSGDLEVALGGAEVDLARYARGMRDHVDAVQVDSRQEAIELVRSGDVLAAIVLPAELPRRLEGSLNLSGGAPPTVEVIYNAEDPVKRRYVESVVSGRLAAVNRALSDLVVRQAAEYLSVVVSGGEVTFPLVGTVDVLGLERALGLVQAARAGLDPDSPESIALGQVARFAELAAQNLDLSGPVLASIESPVEVRERAIGGDSSPLDAYAAALAVVVSLMFVALLLGAGMLAAERDERVYARLVRGLVSRGALVAEKIGVAALCGLLVGLLMLCGLALTLGLDLGRLPWWLLVLALAGLAFAALGVAIGAIARDVRTASLLAFALMLPVVVMGLVPSGAVDGGAFATIGAVSAAFPFKPALQALDATVSGGDPLGQSLHLAALVLAFGLLARITLRRSG